MRYNRNEGEGLDGASICKGKHVVKVKVLNPVHSLVTQGADLLVPCLSYTAAYWKRGIHHVEKKYYKKVLLRPLSNGRFIFLTGFLSRVAAYCRNQGFTLSVDKGDFGLHPTKPPQLPNAQLRPDQVHLANQAWLHQRGVIQAPTGSGKTLIAIGIVSCLPTAKVLFLCHTKSLITQAAENFRKQGFGSISEMVEGKLNYSGQIVVATRQTLSKIFTKNRGDADACKTMFDIVFLDETHHLSDFEGQYSKILTHLHSPMRIGLTATLPEKAEAIMAIEGHLGPLIGRLTVEEGHELGILSEPKVKLVEVSSSSALEDLRRYKDIYEQAIVNSERRNTLIVREARRLQEEGKTCLILVSRLDHGQNLVRIGKEWGLSALFVQGSTERQVRVQVQEALRKKDVKCVVATAVWREGVDIPSLDCVINACGGKSEIQTLQAIGRGLRRTPDKDKVLIVDFLDPYTYLAKHTVARISVYARNGWL